MEVTTATFQKAASDFWHSATDPLHRLTWQTGVMALFILLVAALAVGVLLRYSWMFTKPALRGIIIKRVPHTFRGHMRLSPPDYLKFHKRSPLLRIEDDAQQALMNKDASRYYLVTIVEAGKRRALMYKEMRLHVATRRGRTEQNAVQLDQEDLTSIRVNNGYEEDDHPDPDIAGTYNVYIRRVRYYDLRHWLMHPSREIRTVVWVTLITTTLPTIIDVFFG